MSTGYTGGGYKSKRHLEGEEEETSRSKRPKTEKSNI